MASSWLFAVVGSYLQRMFVLFLFWFLLVVQAQVGNERSRAEVQVLDKFRQKMERTPLTAILQGLAFFDTWKTTDDNPCAWMGVTCTANLTVEELNLSNWALAWPDGEATQTLQILLNLTDLRRLDMSSNQLGYTYTSALQSIPSNIGNFTELTYLDLSGNVLFGEIPPSIAACRSLRYLYLQYNYLQGEIPSLRDMVNLQVLSLAGNWLTGQFPSELGNSSSGLVRIDLSGNMLNGTIPSLPYLTNLMDLRLDNNAFSKFEEPWSMSSRLAQLVVSANQLEGTIPPSITNLVNLRSLNLSGNRLSGDIPSGFSGLQTKYNLNLDLSFNQLTGAIPADLLQPSPSIVVTMNLSHNSLTGPIPISSSNTTVQFWVLDLSHNQLSGRISPIFAFNQSVTVYLYLSHNLFSEDIVDVFSAGPGFGQTVDLRLQSNRFTGDLSRIPADWSSNTTSLLYILNLSDNNLEMSSADGLSKLLNVAGSRIIGLNLAGNNFSGTSLPTEPFTMPGSPLQVLVLNDNGLKGEISDAAFGVSSMPSLQFLNISNNEVTGSIPQSLVTIPSLTVLDVSNNFLSGALPVLEPTSPLYNPTFFTGNDGLCGIFYPPCNSSNNSSSRANGVQWWVLFIIVSGCVIIAVGSCLIGTWRWRVYRKRHQQDSDLIKALQERDSAALMSLRELKRATDNFAQSAWLGEGGFGTVFAGTLSDGTKVAIKRNKRVESEQHKQQFLNEVRILSNVNHRYLVKLLGCCMENENSLLVYEFVSNGTLQEHLQRKFGPEALLTWTQRLNIAVQTADALNYLHSAATFPIYHRDVKSANILLTDEVNAKVADFGISKLASVEATHMSTAAVRGTLGYIDPEYYTSYQLTDKSDVYSFGVVLLELISAKPAIDHLRGGDKTSLISYAHPYMKGGNLEGFMDSALAETYSDPTGQGRESIWKVGKLAMKCVEARSKARPSMKEAWKRLQNLWLDLTAASTLQPTSMDDDADNIAPTISSDDDSVLPDFSGNSSTFSLQFSECSGDIEMSRNSSRVKRKLRSRSSQ